MGKGRERKGRRKKFEKREKNELAYYFESKQEDIPRMSRKETERAMVGNFTVEWESAFSLEEEEEGREKERRTESDAGARCVGSQADLDCPLSDLWTGYFFSSILLFSKR